MSRSNSSLLRLLFVGLAAAAGWILGREVLPPTTSHATAAATPPAVGVPASVALPAIPAAASPDPGEPRANGLDREAALRREGVALAERWPASTEEVYRRAFELAAVDPAAGLTLLDPLHTASIEGITTLERELMRGWSESDHPGLLAELERLYREEHRTEDHWLSLLASVVQVENPGRLGETMAWMEKLDKNGAYPLALITLSKLLAHFDSVSLPFVTEFLLKRIDQPAYREQIPTLANLQAHKNPERALGWLGEIPDANLRRETMLHVLAAVSTDDPARASEWINSGRLWTAAGMDGRPASSENQALLDEVLMTYLGALVSAHPQLVAQYAGMIVDPASREALLTKADRISRSDAGNPYPDISATVIPGTKPVNLLAP